MSFCEQDVATDIAVYAISNVIANLNGADLGGRLCSIIIESINNVEKHSKIIGGTFKHV